ncbi:GIY-YIG nuclease family protein [Sorangium sp. So ce1151]|uniref:GIY-YIG nuclease family protein n=1 Tax=Sorangium sp. So ce1151 TaxID=3133332 RepID=UPI003F5EE3F7
MSTLNRAELGDASVPLEFDVHAMIWSEDAPALENALRREVHYRRVNLINERKEFFHVEIDEVAEVVRKLHGEIEITKLAEAKEHRQSVAKRQERQVAKCAGLPLTPPPSQVEPMPAFASA